MTRREILALAGAPLAAAASARFVKSICSAIFPAGTPYAACFKLAKNAGFDAIEVRMEEKGDITPRWAIDDMKRLREDAASTKIEIASLWILTPRSPSLASPDPAVRERA